jgi:hypothetical protein
LDETKPCLAGPSERVIPEPHPCEGAFMKIRTYCHHCNSDLKLAFFTETQTYFCFKCRAWGRFKELPEDTQLHVTGENPTPRPRSFTYGTDLDAEVPDLNLPDGFKLITKGGMGCKYLEGRHIDPTSLVPFVGTHENYIYFPIWENGNIVYYISRKMYGTGYRYLAAETSGSHFIFAPYTMPLDNSVLVITEGVFDALANWQHVNLPTLAILGKSVNVFKIKRLLDYIKEDGTILICLDPEVKDPETIGASIELLFKLRIHRKVQVIKNPTLWDLADLDHKLKRRLFAEWI